MDSSPERPPLLTAWQLALCVVMGLALGAAMIYTHIGPGLKPSPPTDTPAYRNQERLGMVRQLANALVQYYKDHSSLPISIPSTSQQICTSYGANCTSKGLVDLSFLTTTGDYIPTIPNDPLGGHGVWGSGLYIAMLPGNKIVITAPLAEAGATIRTSAKL